MGGAIGVAVPMNAAINHIVTSASSGDSVILPAGALGAEILVANDGANPIRVYATGSDTLNGTAGATGVLQPAGDYAVYYFTSANKWHYAPAAGGSFGALTATTFNGNTIATGAGNVAATTGANLFIVDVKKSSATVAPATTALIDVTGLTGQALVAGATYRFRAVLPGLADGTSGQKYAFTYTTATLTSIEATGIGYTASAVAVQHTTTTTNSTLLFDQAAAVVMVILEGTMVVNTGGTVSLQTGTHTGTTAGATYVGSTMEFVRIV